LDNAKSWQYDLGVSASARHRPGCSVTVRGRCIALVTKIKTVPGIMEGTLPYRSRRSRPINPTENLRAAVAY
jgi:hypothetical protein